MRWGGRGNGGGEGEGLEENLHFPQQKRRKRWKFGQTGG